MNEKLNNLTIEQVARNVRLAWENMSRLYVASIVRKDHDAIAEHALWKIFAGKAYEFGCEKFGYSDFSKEVELLG